MQFAVTATADPGSTRAGRSKNFSSGDLHITAVTGGFTIILTISLTAAADSGAVDTDRRNIAAIDGHLPAISAVHTAAADTRAVTGIRLHVSAVNGDRTSLRSSTAAADSRAGIFFIALWIPKTVSVDGSAVDGDRPADLSSSCAAADARALMGTISRYFTVIDDDRSAVPSAIAADTRTVITADSVYDRAVHSERGVPWYADAGMIFVSFCYDLSLLAFLPVNGQR